MYINDDKSSLAPRPLSPTTFPTLFAISQFILTISWSFMSVGEVRASHPLNFH